MLRQDSPVAGKGRPLPRALPIRYVLALVACARGARQRRIGRCGFAFEGTGDLRGRRMSRLHATTIVIQFPNGDLAYDLARQTAVLSVGETFRRDGVLWVVTRITNEVVHVERADAQKSE